jgi:hypothetical protein
MGMKTVRLLEAKEHHLQISMHTISIEYVDKLPVLSILSGLPLIAFRPASLLLTEYPS